MRGSLADAALLSSAASVTPNRPRVPRLRASPFRAATTAVRAELLGDADRAAPHL
ncbi:hypothetical protein [Streptomyces sp. NPDC026589]|uniref:hypothetical protein n=1 Tax=Streptomyces sp. NPDC026589 TaxID=3155609 RepID=UPI0033E1FE65